MKKIKFIAIFIIQLMIFLPAAFSISVSTPVVKETTSSSATIEYTTDVNATSQVQYSDTELVSYGPKVSQDDPATNHTLTIPGLDAETTYYYQIFAKDVVTQNQVVKSNADQFYTFTTKAPADITAPVINNTRFTEFTINSVNVVWDTDDASTSHVEFGVKTPEKKLESTELTTNHIIALEDLEEGQVYDIWLWSCNVDNKCSSKERLQFRAGVDQTPPGMDKIIVPQVVPAGGLTIKGETEPLSYVNVYINNQLVRSRQTDAEGKFQLSNINRNVQQNNNVRVVVRDLAGLESTRDYQVKVDINGPKVKLKDFEEVSTQAQFSIRGHVSEDSLVQIFVDLKKDKVAPVRLPNPPVAAEITADQVRLTWDITDAEDFFQYAIYRNNVLYGVSDKPQFVDKALVPGRVGYRVSVVDTSCNEGPLSDSTTIDLPENVNIRETTIIERLSCEEPAKEFKAKKGDWMQSVSLLEGHNTITVRAIDEAGNIGETQNTTYYDSQPPTWITTNLDGISPTYMPLIDIHGKVSEQAEIFLYINNMEKPVTHVTSKEDGSFELNNVVMYRDVMVKDIDTEKNLGGEVKLGYQNKVKLVAVDFAGRTTPALTKDIIYAKCGAGGLLNVELTDPLPDMFSPRLILESQARVGFNINISKLDESVYMRSEPIISTMQLSRSDQENWDLNFEPSVTWFDDEYSSGYVELAISPPKMPSNMSRHMQEVELSKHRLNVAEEDALKVQKYTPSQCPLGAVGCFRFPLVLTIKYEKPRVVGSQYAKESGREMEYETFEQRECIPIIINVDKPFPTEMFPQKWLKEAAEEMDKIIDQLDKHMKLVTQIVKIATYICLGSQVAVFVGSIVLEWQCNPVRSLLPGSLGFDREVAEQGRCMEYCEEEGTEGAACGKSQKSEGSNDVYDECQDCQNSIDNMNALEDMFNNLCDRVFCPSAPSLQTYIKESKGKKNDCSVAPDTTPQTLDQMWKSYDRHKDDGDEDDSEAYGGVGEGGMSFKVHKAYKELEDKSAYAGFHTQGNAFFDKLNAENAQLNCDNLHPPTAECCAYEYERKYDSVCLIDELERSLCLSKKRAPGLFIDPPLDCDSATLNFDLCRKNEDLISTVGTGQMIPTGLEDKQGKKVFVKVYTDIEFIELYGKDAYEKATKGVPGDIKTASQIEEEKNAEEKAAEDSKKEAAAERSKEKAEASASAKAKEEEKAEKTKDRIKAAITYAKEAEAMLKGLGTKFDQIEGDMKTVSTAGVEIKQRIKTYKKRVIGSELKRVKTFATESNISSHDDMLSKVPDSIKPAYEALYKYPQDIESSIDSKILEPIAQIFEIFESIDRDISLASEKISESDISLTDAQKAQFSSENRELTDTRQNAEQLLDETKRKYDAKKTDINKKANSWEKAKNNIAGYGTAPNIGIVPWSRDYIKAKNIDVTSLTIFSTPITPGTYTGGPLTSITGMAPKEILPEAKGEKEAESFSKGNRTGGIIVYRGAMRDKVGDEECDPLGANKCFVKYIALTDVFSGKHGEPKWDNKEVRDLFEKGLCGGTKGGVPVVEHCPEDVQKTVFDKINNYFDAEVDQHIIDPTDGIWNSIRCVCISSLTAYMKKLHSFLKAVRNCLKSIEVTGDGSEGQCRELIAQGVCDVAYSLFNCAFNYINKGSERMDLPKGDSFLGSFGKGMGNIASGITGAGDRVRQRTEERYGTTNMYKSMFAQNQFIHGACMFAFTGQWTFDPDEMVEAGIESMDVGSQAYVSPARRKFLRPSGPNNENAVWAYRFGFFVNAGSDLRVKMEVKCSEDFSCKGAEGFPNNQCDCKKGEIIRQVPLDTSRVTKYDTYSGEKLWIEEGADIRYDKVRLSWDYKNNEGKAESDDTGWIDIDQEGGVPSHCGFDTLEGKFTCESGYDSKYYARMTDTPDPIYPDKGADKTFVLNQRVKFAVPINQRYPDTQKTSKTEHTKFLVYYLYNDRAQILKKPGEKYVVMTNDIHCTEPKGECSKINPAPKINPIPREEELHFNGESTIILDFGRLTPDWFMQSSGATISVPKTEPKISFDFSGNSQFHEMIEMEKKDPSTFTMTFYYNPNKGPEYDDPKGIFPNARLQDWIKETSSLRIPVGSQRQSAKTELTFKWTEVRSADKSVEKYTIADPYTSYVFNFDESVKTDLTSGKTIKIYLPPSSTAGAGLTEEACKEQFGKVPLQFEAKFEIRDAEKKGTSYIMSPTSKTQTDADVFEKIQFQVLCNDELIDTTDKSKPGVCPEHDNLDRDCACYLNEADVKQDTDFNCGPGKSTADKPRVMCSDGKCIPMESQAQMKSKGIVPMCKPDTLTTEECLCSAEDNALCNAGQKCIVQDGQNKCVANTCEENVLLREKCLCAINSGDTSTSPTDTCTADMMCIDGKCIKEPEEYRKQYFKDSDYCKAGETDCLCGLNNGNRIFCTKDKVQQCAIDSKGVNNCVQNYCKEHDPIRGVSDNCICVEDISNIPSVTNTCGFNEDGTFFGLGLKTPARTSSIPDEELDRAKHYLTCSDGMCVRVDKLSEYEFCRKNMPEDLMCLCSHEDALTVGNAVDPIPRKQCNINPNGINTIIT